MLKSQIDNIPSKGKLRFYRSGSGEHLILLHGYPDNHHIWDELIPHLTADFEVLAFDWPGMGESDLWPSGTAPSQMAKRLIAILDHFGIAKAHLAGHDMGGQPALVAAADFPDRVLSVTVMNSLVIEKAKTSWEIKYLRKLGFNRFLLTYFPKIVFKRAVGSFGLDNQTLPAELERDFWTSFKTKEVRRFIVRMCFGYQAQLPKLIKYYEKITVPVLILWSAQGRHFHPSHAEELHKLIQNSQIDILPDTGHWMAHFDAEMISRKILDFRNGRR